MDKKTASMTTAYDFFRWASHIDVYSIGSVGFYDFCCFDKIFYIFSKNLKNHRFFYIFMRKYAICQKFAKNKPICAIKFTDTKNMRCDTLDALSIRAISVAVHGGEKTEFFMFLYLLRPKIFIHK